MPHSLHASSTSALKIASTLTLAPVLIAGLIGCLPLLISCIACRCCKELLAYLRQQIDV